MDFEPLLKVIPIFALALISPGPDFMVVSSTALSRGRGAGIMTAAGITLGNLIYILLSMLGMGIVLAKMQWLAVAIRICGGAYLVYIGIQLWRASLKKPDVDSLARHVPKNRNPFMAGFLTFLTNPKAIAFFTSIFALTLPPEINLSTQAVILGVMLMMVFGWFSAVSLGLSTPAMRKVYLKWSQWIDRVAGTFLTLFGLKLMVSIKK